MDIFESDDVKVEVTESSVVITIPLLEEPFLSASGKSHIVAQVEGWTKTKIGDPANGERTIMLPPLMVISK